MMIVQEQENRDKARSCQLEISSLNLRSFFLPCTIFKSGFNSINLFIEAQCISVVMF